jgi:hypothetical protein
MKDHSPNEGENNMHFSGNSEGGRSSSIVDKAGVEDGLSSMEACADCKNMGDVTHNQRPMADSMSSGSFKIGT